MNLYLREYTSGEVQSLLEIVRQNDEQGYLTFLLEMVAAELNTTPQLQKKIQNA